jgi:hypothetical protein
MHWTDVQPCLLIVSYEADGRVPDRRCLFVATLRLINSDQLISVTAPSSYLELAARRLFR